MKEISKDCRIAWLDCAKGIAMVMVIFAHTISSQVLRGAIYSFHMPLFFLLSGYTFKPSKSSSNMKMRTKKWFKQLVIFSVICFLIRHFLILFRDDVNFVAITDVGDYIVSILFSLLMASGADCKIGDFDVPAMGMYWFPITLFGVRILYDKLYYLTKGKSMTILSVVISITGVVIGSFVCLPFSLDLIFAVAVFYHIGKLLSKTDIKGKVIAAAFINCILWIISILGCYVISNGYMELACRRYPAFPVSYITAIVGSVLVCCVCILLQNWKLLFDKMSIIGRNSLSLFFIHSFDVVWYKLYYKLVDNEYVVAVIRIFIDLIILYVVVRVSDYFKKQVQRKKDEEVETV